MRPARGGADRLAEAPGCRWRRSERWRKGGGGSFLSSAGSLGTDPETEEAQKAQGWVRVYLPPENETRAKKGLWYCECCHDLLPDIPPVHRVLPPRKED